MPKRRVLSPQSVWDWPAVSQAFEDAGVANVELHVVRLWGHLVRHPSHSWHDVLGLPKLATAALDAGFVKFTSKLKAVQRSGDDSTLKLLLEFQGGFEAEAVVMRYDTHQAGPEGGSKDADAAAEGSSAGGETGNVRSTLCVSSQVGCQMGCKFCATGTMGLLGNLTAGEIVEQLAYARQLTTVRNVVFMGMGEPLDNYPHVSSALRMMVDPRLFALAPRHITVSTVGVVPRILQLAHDFPRVSFALSLHAPNQALRESIVPSAKAHKLPKLIAAIKEYQTITARKVFIEYVMLEGVNDEPHHAEELAKLLEGHAVTVNLIPWNPVLSPDMTFGAPSVARVQAFRAILHNAHGIRCTVRQEKGQEISGACGQLVLESRGSKNTGGDAHGGKGAVRDIEELAARMAACA